MSRWSILCLTLIICVTYVNSLRCFNDNECSASKCGSDQYAYCDRSQFGSSKQGDCDCRTRVVPNVCYKDEECYGHCANSKCYNPNGGKLGGFCTCPDPPPEQRCYDSAYCEWYFMVTRPALQPCLKSECAGVIPNEKEGLCNCTFESTELLNPLGKFYDVYINNIVNNILQYVG